MDRERIQSVREAFTAALDHAPEEREAYVRRACGHDESLVRVVLALLEADASDDDDLERRVASSMGELLRREDPEGLDRLREFVERLEARSTPELRYSPRGEIAHGGMGRVLEVWDENLRRLLAMKVATDPASRLPDAERGDTEPRTLGRFIEEAQITGQLDHPGIVPVHELGIDSGGRVFFTMKLVQGQTLSVILDASRAGDPAWPQVRVLGALLKVCEAMAYAHAKGVIHRDLKPANVMVGRFGEVFVMDWGVAKVVGAADSHDLTPEPGAEAEPTDEDREPQSPMVTRDGTVIGTPAYMPPEQARGDLHRLDARGDVYSIGCMLYQLLAGAMPYATPGARVSGPAIWRRVVAGPPPPVEELAPDARPELVAICEKAMAREPDDRYPTVLALADDLRAFLEGRVVAAFERGAWAEARKWVGRNRALAASLAAAVLLLVAGLAASLLLAERERRARVGVFRLSAFQRLDDLRASADALWPVRPELIDEYEDWLERANDVVDGLGSRSDSVAGGHLAQLAELRARGRPAPDGDGLEFERDEDRWWFNQLEKLVSEVELFADEDAGLVLGISETGGWGVQRRLELARTLEREFRGGGAARERWKEAAPALAAAYPGLELPVQTGLVPLGPDPRSGLWEFWHLPSGDEPTRGADGEWVVTEATGLVFVLLPGGTFTMGAQSSDPAGPNYDPEALANESPPHAVELSPFFLSKYEMTQGQWARFVGRNPSYHRDSPLVTSLAHPVEQVSWFDCVRMLSRMGLHLPSEAQWEYGARGGTSTPWWTGRERESLVEREAANLADQAAVRAGYRWTEIRDWPELEDGWPLHAPVGSLSANPFGLHDVHGNVWEWCRDGYDPDFYATSPALDPVAPPEASSKRTNRGGSYYSTASGSRCAKRALRVNNAPSSVGGNLGLRPARPVVR